VQLETPAAGHELCREQRGQLTHGHSMLLRDRRTADPRLQFRAQHRSRNAKAAERVRPIQHHHPPSAGCGSGHHVEQGPHIGVEAGADVLDVEHDRVDPGPVEGVRHRCRRQPVQVVHGQPGTGVGRRALGPAGLRRAPETVLRTEYRPQLDAAGRMQHVDDRVQ
jgi:hypothetical protein